MKTYDSWLVGKLMENTDYTKDYLYSKSTGRMFYYVGDCEVELFTAYDHYEIYLKECINDL